MDKIQMQKMNLTAFKDLTRIEQTLFGLPFVIAGALLALMEKNCLWLPLFWIFPAFFMARISGMAFNQWIDHKIDARNPRTKNRAIPSGRVTPDQAKTVAWLSLGLFLFFTWKINWLCFLFAPLLACLLIFYSYMKRFHASCHFILGSIHFFVPLMAYMALSQTCSLGVLCLGLASFFSICGTDIIYAVQDYHFDCEEKLHSIPSKIGIGKSFQLSQILHFLCVVFLIGLGIFSHLPLIYYGVVLAVGATFFHFHTSILRQYEKTDSVGGIESVFFFANVAVSLSILFFVALSVVWDVLL